jgi:hypothetical protein
MDLIRRPIGCLASATTLLFLAQPALRAQTDVSYFSIQKIVLYDQTAANTTSLDLRKPYQFSSNIQGGTTGIVLSSSDLVPPVPSTGVVAYQDEGGGQSGLYFNEGFTSQSALDAAFANGTYNFTIQTSTPNTYASPLNLGAANYPAVPQIISVTYGPSNAAATWSNGMVVIPDNTKAITVTWNNPSGTNDGYFQINNTSINSNSTPVSNTFTIAANALSNNTVYQGSIILTNGNGTSSSIPGVNSQASYQSQVNFYLQLGTPTISSGIYEVQKTHVLTQTSNIGPADGSGDINNFDPAPYDFYVTGLVPGTATGPSSTSFVLTSNGSGNKYRYRSGSYISSASVDSAAPDGTYTFPGAGGSVNLSGTGAGNGYPAAAQIMQVNNATPVWDAQGQLVLDPAVPNTITWSPVAVSLTTNGHESVQLSASSGNSLLSQQAGVTQSSTTQFTQLVIPASTMTAADTYIGEISYFQASSFNTLVAGTTYAAAGYQTENFFTVVALKPQTITFGPIASQLLGEGSYTLGATASSGLPITYNLVSGPATLNGAVLTFTGTGTITVTASQPGDGTYASVPGVTQPFAVTGGVPLDFHDWEAQYFNQTQMGDPTISGPTATPEHDGVSNLLKYLFNIDPARPMPASDRVGLPVLGTLTVGQTQYITLTFRDYSLREGNPPTVEMSPDLKSWSDDTNPNDQPTPTGATDGVTGDPYDIVKVPISGARGFIRLQVTMP